MKNEMNENELVDVIGGLLPAVIVAIKVKVTLKGTAAAAGGGGFAAGYIAGNRE